MKLKGVMNQTPSFPHLASLLGKLKEDPLVQAQRGLNRNVIIYKERMKTTLKCKIKKARKQELFKNIKGDLN